MNGRLYDPELGRMLSPDPYVQVPEYSQNFNRYSYVLNNPLNLTDPTGFSWLGKMFGGIGFDWMRKNWRTVLVIVVVAVVASLTAGAFLAAAGPLGSVFATAAAGTTAGSLTMVGGAVVGGIAGAVGGGLSAALAGGNLGDVLRGAAISGVQGAITGGLLHGLEGAAGDATGMAKVGLLAAHRAGHGVVGGASNAAMGGKFSDGFYSAAIAAEASSYGPFVNMKGAEGVVARTVQASVVGGTVSVIGGGKFANGAYTAAFQHLLNFELPAAADRLKSKEESAGVKDAITESLTTNPGSPPNLSDTQLTIVMKEYMYTLQERNPGFFGWVYDTAGKADTMFHHLFPGVKFNFSNTSNNPLLPKSGSYLGSDINYVAVGINFGAANATLTSVAGTAGHNYVQAIISGGIFTANGRRNIGQIFSAQKWTRAGFDYGGFKLLANI